jgi:hypothetical protein
MTLFQKLDEIRGQILESTKLDELFEDLQDKISTFLAQFAIQAGLNSTLKLVQETSPYRFAESPSTSKSWPREENRVDHVVVVAKAEFFKSNILHSLVRRIDITVVRPIQMASEQYIQIRSTGRVLASASHSP